MKLFNNEAPSETRTSSLSVEDVLLHFFEDELLVLHMKMFYFVSLNVFHLLLYHSVEILSSISYEHSTYIAA
jgi:hypothetical protein|nr:MAG TPA: hypothetical protein [Caudoviricetes sp.]